MAKTETFSVRPDATLSAWLDARTSDAYGEGRPTVALTALDRYQLILRKSLPNLTTQEWAVLHDVCNGTIFDRAELALALEHSLSDCEPSRYDYHGADRAALLAKIATWTVAERLATVDAIECFWRKVDK